MYFKLNVIIKMENLSKKASNQNFCAKLNPEEGKIIIVGSSIGAKANQQLNDLLDKLNSFVLNPTKKTHVQIYLSYFDTTSASIIWKIFRTLEKLNVSKRSKVQVTWLNNEEDWDLIESANVYQEICPSLPIKKTIWSDFNVAC